MATDFSRLHTDPGFEFEGDLARRIQDVLADATDDERAVLEAALAHDWTHELDRDTIDTLLAVEARH